MADCIVCQQLASKIGVIYDDNEVTAMLTPTPAAPGQIIVSPKEHLLILEQVPDWIIAKMFKVANKISIALFESGIAQGTNLIIPNGDAAGQSIAHTSLHIVPRMGDDDLELHWQPTQIGQEQLNDAEQKISSNVGSGTFITEKPKSSEPVDDTPEEISDEENELIKSLRRIP
jgi:histidine triad (HIT) family protein